MACKCSPDKKNPATEHPCGCGGNCKKDAGINPGNQSSPADVGEKKPTEEPKEFGESFMALAE